jgi:hypothetical protein
MALIALGFPAEDPTIEAATTAANETPETTETDQEN